MLAWVFGFHFLPAGINPELREHIHRAGYFVTFFLLCGASRLARFNIQENPIPRNPGKPDRKYFVGLPIPAAAGMVAAAIYVANSSPPDWWWPLSVAWLALVGMLSLLMVSTWRYRSFKDFNMLQPRSPISVVRFGVFIYLIWNYSQPVLLAMSVTYVGSGIVIRLGGIIKRKFRPVPPHPQHQVS